ncbi:MAG: ATP synthase F0 subunit B [Lachnospiraceae bacterium]|nr:ATP synthase F0 subunit B [Lachnospiraceae bacterium]
MVLGIDFLQIFLHLFNIILLFGGLYIILYKPVKDFMEKREAHYRKMDEDAAEKIKAANEAKEKYEKALEQVGDEIADRKKAASEEIARMKQSQEEKARKDAERIIDEAKAEGERRKANIVDDAREDIARMIEEATGKILLDRKSGSSFDSFLAEAEKANGGNSDGRK